ncbi:transmembrane protein 39A [Trichonephila clavipes]|nr:transmembrane protein 39A [Trichonephila clavipes]
MWNQGALVKHSKELFKAEGIANAAEPGHSGHSRFYSLFKDPSTSAKVIWLLQLLLITAEMLILVQSHTWNDLISIQLLIMVNSIQPEVRFIAKQNSLMKIGNNGNLVLGPFDESTPCLMIVLMNCQTKLRINHLTVVKSVAILEKECERKEEIELDERKRKEEIELAERKRKDEMEIAERKRWADFKQRMRDVEMEFETQKKVIELEGEDHFARACLDIEVSTDRGNVGNEVRSNLSSETNSRLK